MKQFFLVSNACGRTTAAVSRRIQSYLQLNGMTQTSALDAADLVIVDTCGYCRSAEDESIGIIRHCLMHGRPDAQVAVVGCLPQINPWRLSEAGNITVLAPNAMSTLDAMTDARIPFASVPEGEQQLMLPEALLKPGASKPTRAFHLNTSTGCLHHCSLCAVKKVWGQLVSRPIAAIVGELEVGLKTGHELFYLAAQDLGAYGVDRGVSVVDLLTALFEVEGTFRLMLHDFNPQWLIKHLDALTPLLRSHAHKVAYLDIPLQSASDPVLRRMKRPYRSADVRDALFALKAAVPELTIELDVMMGFPGETDEDFARSVDFVKECIELPRMCIWLTGFSARPDTEAAALEQQLDADVIMRRFLALRDLVDASDSKLGTGMAYYPEYTLY